MARCLIVLLLAFVLAGCSGAEAGPTVPATVPSSTAAASATTASPNTTTTTEAASTTGAPQTTRPAPTVTTVAASTTTGAGAIPLPNNRGDNFSRIARQLNDFGGWLFENPDPSLVEVMSVPDSPDFEEFSAIMEEYVANGWRDLPGGRSRIVDAELINLQDEGKTALVVVLSEYDGATTVDQNGEVVKEDPGREPAYFLYELKFSPEHGWRLYESRFLRNQEDV